MVSAAVIRSFNCPVGTVSHRRSMVARHNAFWPALSKLHIQGFTIGGKFASYPLNREGKTVSFAKASETTMVVKSNDIGPQGLLEKNSLPSATFLSEFETLVLDVCDETQVAELKLKVGDFEMHVKRNTDAPKAPMAVISPTPPPYISKTMTESAPASLPSPPPKSPTENTSPFTNVYSEKSAKLAALEDSGSSGYVLVSSPTVGAFRKGRTLKGKKQPPICKEGDVINEGQVIGFVDQFNAELPVKSDVAGEVLKLLVKDEDAIGYGDYLIAVLPSFPGIKVNLVSY